MIDIYEILNIVGIAFWVSVAAYFAVRGITALCGLHRKTIESVREEKEKTQPPTMQAESQTVMETDSPKSTTVSFSTPVVVRVPTKARSIWVLKQISYDGDWLGAVSWDIEKLKSRCPGIKWVEDSDGWHEPKKKPTDEQWVIEPIDFIQ